jgi:hypothetical protein
MRRAAITKLRLSIGPSISGFPSCSQLEHSTRRGQPPTKANTLKNSLPCECSKGVTKGDDFEGAELGLEVSQELVRAVGMVAQLNWMPEAGGLIG